MWKMKRKANQFERAISCLGEAERAVSMIYLKLGHPVFVLL
jgi:hypothetical protein